MGTRTRDRSARVVCDSIALCSDSMNGVQFCSVSSSTFLMGAIAASAAAVRWVKRGFNRRYS